MAYVVMSQCVDEKFLDCVYVCPVDCFVDIGNMLIIDPELCIDCDACVPACPVEAIVPEDDVPEEEAKYTKLMYDYFEENDAATVDAHRITEESADAQLAERKAAESS